MVLISLCNSCNKKSIFLPTGTASAPKDRNCSTSLFKRVNSSVTSAAFFRQKGNFLKQTLLIQFQPSGQIMHSFFQSLFSRDFCHLVYQQAGSFRFVEWCCNLSSMSCQKPRGKRPQPDSKVKHHNPLRLPTPPPAGTGASPTSPCRPGLRRSVPQFGFACA